MLVIADFAANVAATEPGMAITATCRATRSAAVAVVEHFGPRPHFIRARRFSPSRYTAEPASIASLWTGADHKASERDPLCGSAGRKSEKGSEHQEPAW